MATSSYSQCLPIPTKYIPYIIGKNGKTINNIESGSRTKISISQDKFNTDWHYIKITGESNSIDLARKWIIKCLISAADSNA